MCKQEITAWQARPLEPMYPVVCFDARRVRIRDEATVRIKAVYVALGASSIPFSPSVTAMRMS